MAMDEERLISLEIKIAYQEDTITQLNDIVCEQQNQIDALERLTQQLLGRVRDLSDSASQSANGMLADDERPPHY
jgi:SlyX protein